MAGKQQEIDFSKCQKYGILNRAELPKIKDVGAPLLALLLRVIYGHSGDDGWCFASQETLARECRCKDRKQIGRAIRGLVEHFLIVVEARKFRPEGRNVNHMRICWGNLAALSEGVQAEKRDTPLGHSGGGHWDIFPTPLGHSGGGHWDRAVPLITPKNQEPPPTSTPEAVAVEIETWEEAEQQLRAEGVAIASKLVREAKASGKSARDVLVVIHDYRANRSRLRGPGAIVTRLRDGAWPEDGIVSGEAQRAKIDALAKDREWKLICTTAKAIEREARRRGASPEERRKELRQKIPPDVLAVLMQDELKFVFE